MKDHWCVARLSLHRSHIGAGAVHVELEVDPAAMKLDSGGHRQVRVFLVRHSAHITQLGRTAANIGGALVRMECLQIYTKWHLAQARAGVRELARGVVRGNHY
jgi:hypothetical protein